MTSFVKISLLLFLAIIAMGLTKTTKMDLVHEWKYIDYVWPSPEHKQSSIEKGHYNYKNPVLADVERSKDGRTFVTVVGGKGVPASLNTISKQNGTGGPLLEPYPDWSWHQPGDCEGITSVYRVAIDKCNRLWVLDNGVMEGKQVCTAKLIAINLSTNRVIRQIKIPDSISQNPKTHKGLLINPIVQTEGDNCEETRIFIADVHGRGLIVTNLRDTWRIDSPFFAPDSSPNSANVSIAGESVTLEYGIFGLALSPKIDNDPQFLVYRPFASRSLFGTNVNDIMRTSPENQTLPMVTFPNLLPSQSTVHAFNSQGTLFFGLTHEIAIGCFSEFQDPIPRNVEIVAQDDETLQFVSGMKVISPSDNQPEEELWVSTNRYHKIELGSMNFNEVNYRILKQSVEKLISGTKCEAPTRIKNQIKHRCT